MPLQDGALPGEIDRWFQHHSPPHLLALPDSYAVAVSADVTGITIDAGEEALTVNRFNAGVAQRYF